MNGTGTSCESPSSGRCSVGEQRRPGRNQATARMKWTKEMNIVVMQSFHSAQPFDENGVPKRGYRQRMFRAWREKVCVTRLSKECMIRLEPLGKMAGYRK